MTCLIDSGAGREMASHPLTVGAVLGRTPMATHTSTASTSAPNAGDARPSSSRAGTRVSRSGARYAVGVCGNCKGPKPPGRGRKLCDSCAPDTGPVMCKACRDTPVLRGCHYCATCRELAREAAAARKRARDRVKYNLPCRGCGGLKPPGRRVVYCRACVRKRNERQRICERCENPARSPTALLCLECKAKADDDRRAYGRQWMAAKGNRKRSKRRADSQRMKSRLRTEREGGSLSLAPPIMVKTSGDGHQRRADSLSFPGLPVGPFVAMIDRLIVKERAKLYELALVTMGGPDGAQGTICNLLGVHDRRLNIWRKWIREDAEAIGPRLANGRFSPHWGDGASVSFDVADGALSAAGLLWFDVWKSDDVCTNGRNVEWVFETTELLADAA